MLGPILSWRHCPPPRKTINVATVLLDTCIHRRVQLLVVHRYFCCPRGLSVNFATVGFIYNYPCPLKCNFCCHTKENVGEGRLHPGNVVPLILDSPAMKTCAGSHLRAAIRSSTSARYSR